MNHRILYKLLPLLLFLLPYPALVLYPQVSEKTSINGTVTDANTGYPVPYVSVYLKGTTVGTITDTTGRYHLETPMSANEIVFSFLGYQTETRVIKMGVSQIINIRLKLSSIALEQVDIKPATRKNYRNKNNPAVGLIEKVIKNKTTNRKEAYDFLEYRTYEKVQLALSDVNERLTQARLFNKFSFVFNNIDTTKRISNNVLPLFIKESIADYYYRKNPEATKEIVRAEKRINLDEYLDHKGVTENLNYLYQDINIYDNEILFMSNKFVSPIATTAPAFYRYYIQDSLTVKGIPCIKLFFEPRNRADFLFHGNLYITMDSSYAICKIDLGINKKINIDWIKDISIIQDFEQFENNSWLLSKEEISIDAGVVKNTLGLYAQRIISYTDYKFNSPIEEVIFNGPLTTDKIDPLSSNPDYWNENRLLPLTATEKQLYAIADSVKKVPSFRRQMDVVMLLTTSFLNLGKIELGPCGSFYSYNTVEGSRVRFGGRTTPDFSRKINIDAYGAYGFADRIYKYSTGVTWSLTPRTIYEFPVKSIRISYQKETSIPGLDLESNEQDNLFLSLKRGVDDKLFLNNTLRLEFFNEFDNHFSFLAGYSYTRQQPKGNLFFVNSETQVPVNNFSYLNISELYLNLRYAPNETFYQGKLYRDYFMSKYPVLQLKLTGGLKEISNDYDYLRLQISIKRKYYISVIGYSDIKLEAGQLFGNVPYPLLFIHNANQTYAYEQNAYNLMNFLEFVSDRYASLNIDNSFNGFIFNKIPLLKKLKLRELVTCKILYGGLGRNNNPGNNASLFKFPVNDNNVPLTYTFKDKPYIEASVGVSNIFRILRVDLIKRFTYLDHPNVTDLGVRFMFKLDI